MAIDLSTLQSLGLPEITLWLLSFAILYGLMSQVKIPESQAARAIISIVIAFFVILSAPLALTNVLSKMTSSLVIVLIGIIVLLIFVKSGGLQLLGWNFNLSPVASTTTIFLIIIIIAIVWMVGERKK